MRRRGASGGGSRIRTARAVANGNMPGSQIHDGGRDEKRGDAARAAIHQLGVFALDDVEPADARRNVHAYFIEIRVLRFPCGHLDGKIRARQGHLNEAAHLLQFFFLDPPEGIEIFNLAANFAIKSCGVKKRNGADTALPGHEVGPTFLGSDAQRADQSDARHNYAASQLFGAPC